jgi:hypothetical protein
MFHPAIKNWFMKKDRSDWTVKKFSSFAEAEEADNIFWANTTEEYRLNTLIDLRATFFGTGMPFPIEKVVYKRNIYEQA